MPKIMSQDESASVRTKLYTFYRSPLFNAIILGLVSFTQPGIWSALAGLGAGGLATPYFVNAANVITFAIMIVLSPIFAVMGNRWSLKWILVIGTIGYAPYSASLYTNSVYGTQWFMLLGAATCGISAAALWVSEAAIGVGYPEESRKGLYIAIWFGLNKIGSIIASSVQLALNFGNDKQGSISSETYLVLIALQCLGLPLALLISPIDELIRNDGTKPARPERTTFAEGFRRFWRIMKRPEIAALIPIFLTSQWAQTYEGNYLTTYFTVRSRALASFVITLLGLAVNMVFGWFLDYDRLSRATRARAGWIILVITYTITYIYNLVLEAEYEKTSPVFDIETPGFARAVAVYCIFFIPYNAFSVWGYWILGCFDDKIENLTFSAAVLRSGESLASTISYALGASKSVSLLKNILVASVLFWAAIPTTTWSAWQVEEYKREDEVSEDVYDSPQLVNVTVKGPSDV
ncbi:unnamed protein product [Penicillium salamii]|uniref:Major facilitator superfamily domain, general substrate transporter n=1 Tax=Penicillium salamii TaxID=1612424 RepID=A0A9W4K6M6_9EURO|nr:unnamed protein product [Penicillium salamii]CAG8108728.1 unnamed protein product [Penicillium salamii]CAG8183046.1 unnamed protein product [Penicillium salamii]CAG8198786.1 unnamed protein product [Penicillium salamii]CAG8205662.1 unnamed protein product [Penicillium salamii]